MIGQGLGVYRGTIPILCRMDMVLGLKAVTHISDFTEDYSALASVLRAWGLG